VTFCGSCANAGDGILDVVQRAIGIGLQRELDRVTDSPSVIDDEMCRTPSTPETPSSIVLVTCDSSSDGAAPNCETATEITGMSALGSRVTASLVKLTSLAPAG